MLQFNLKNPSSNNNKKASSDINILFYFSGITVVRREQHEYLGNKIIFYLITVLLIWQKY